MNIADAPDVLTVPQVAELLAIGTKQTYAACKAGEIPAIRLGRTLRVSKAALLRLLDPTQEDAPAASDSKGAVPLSGEAHPSSATSRPTSSAAPRGPVERSATNGD